MLTTAAGICHRCLKFTGPWVCPEDLVSISVHAMAADCPRGLHAGIEPPAPGTSLPAQDSDLAGDVLAELGKRLGADRVAAWYSRVTGRDCGCPDRQAWLNRVHGWIRKMMNRTS